MVKLAESKGKSGEGFVRIFGDQNLGLLLSKVQSSVIRSGFELETLISVMIPISVHTTLNDLMDLSQNIARPDIQVVFKPSKPNPDDPKKSIQADLLIVDNPTRTFTLVEIKEGYVFDTKKADGELDSLRNITSWLAQEFPYRAEYYICSFNQENKNLIVAGSKKRFPIERVMTGRELCNRLSLDYDTIVEIRRSSQDENLEYFLSELLSIPRVRNLLIQMIDSQ